MNGILQMEIKPMLEDENNSSKKPSQKDLENELKTSSKTSKNMNLQSEISQKNEDQISKILEVILGDYLPSDFCPSTKLTKDSTEKAAIILEELLLERK